MTTALGASGAAAQAARPARNPGTPLDLSFLTRVRINKSAVERRATTLVTRRTIKQEWQAAWLLRAVSTIDLTTLAGDDTPGNVQRLCAKARSPVREDLLEALGMAGRGLHVAAVCVYHARVPDAVEAHATLTWVFGPRAPMYSANWLWPMVRMRSRKRRSKA